MEWKERYRLLYLRFEKKQRVKNKQRFWCYKEKFEELKKKKEAGDNGRA